MNQNQLNVQKAICCKVIYWIKMILLELYVLVNQICEIEKKEESTTHSLQISSNYSHHHSIPNYSQSEMYLPMGSPEYFSKLYLHEP